jgi:hypothetical protein
VGVVCVTGSVFPPQPVPIASEAHAREGTSPLISTRNTLAWGLSAFPYISLKECK